jgi:hypothetical protein
MQNPMIGRPFLAEGYLQGCCPLLRGISGVMTQGTNIRRVKRQNSSVLATFYPSLGRRVGECDVSQAGEEHDPSATISKRDL